MEKRRAFLRQCSMAVGALCLGSVGAGRMDKAFASAGDGWVMPDEGERHQATWMAFGPSEDVWGGDLLKGAQRALASIAKVIAAHEPVHMLVREDDYDLAETLCGSSVNLIVQDIDSLWMRDTCPVFVKNGQGQLAGIKFNFNGWGGKQEHEADALVASAVNHLAKVPTLTTRLVLEGGGIEVDGAGTAIMTESCILNRNRNPGLSKAACEAELKRLLGLEKIIWLPGVAGKDITDGHTDFYARFARPGVVVAGLDTDPSSFDHAVTQRHLDILRHSVDAKGRKLEVVVLPAPSTIRPTYENKEFAAGYVNFYVCNGAVIGPEFGDAKADRDARAMLRELFPSREVIQVNIDAIAAGGGGIHCTTQQQPA